ncbi:MAG: hypothetical protein FJ087_19730, partial [Deltaproteobacteria bacterium]|nr:hypothetical protein [Deltaproteobacteria bacterium]
GAAPPVKGTAPLVQGVAPPVKEAAPPVKGTAPPVQEAAPPVKEAAPPVKGTGPPVQGAAPPVQAAAPPVQGTAPPVQGAAPPVKEAAPPVQGVAPPVQEAAPLAPSVPPCPSAADLAAALSPATAHREGVALRVERPHGVPVVVRPRDESLPALARTPALDVLHRGAAGPDADLPAFADRVAALLAGCSSGEFAALLPPDPGDPGMDTGLSARVAEAAAGRDPPVVLEALDAAAGLPAGTIVGWEAREDAIELTLRTGAGYDRIALSPRDDLGAAWARSDALDLSPLGPLPTRAALEAIDRMSTRAEGETLGTLLAALEPLPWRHVVPYVATERTVPLPVALGYLAVMLAIPGLALALAIGRRRLGALLASADLAVALGIWGASFAAAAWSGGGTYRLLDDLARDLGYARLCADAGRCVLYGPEAHDLGFWISPVFRYLLAAAHLLDPSVQSFWWVGTLGAACIPATAYVAGTTLLDRTTGAAAAVLSVPIALRALGHVGDLHHYWLAPPIAAAHLVAMVGLWREGGGLWLVAAVATALLAACFHLTAAPLAAAPVAIALIRRDLRTGMPGWAWAAVAAYGLLWIAPTIATARGLPSVAALGASRDPGDGAGPLVPVLLAAGAAALAWRVRRDPGARASTLAAAVALGLPLVAFGALALVLRNRFSSYYLAPVLPAVAVLGGLAVALPARVIASRVLRRARLAAVGGAVIAIAAAAGIGAAAAGHKADAWVAREGPAFDRLRAADAAAAVAVLSSPPWCLDEAALARVHGLGATTCCSSALGVLAPGETMSGCSAAARPRGGDFVVGRLPGAPGHGAREVAALGGDRDDRLYVFDSHAVPPNGVTAVVPAPAGASPVQEAFALPFRSQCGHLHEYYVAGWPRSARATACADARDLAARATVVKLRARSPGLLAIRMSAACPVVLSLDGAPVGPPTDESRLDLPLPDDGAEHVLTVAPADPSACAGPGPWLRFLDVVGFGAAP